MTTALLTHGCHMVATRYVVAAWPLRAAWLSCRVLYGRGRRMAAARCVVAVMHYVLVAARYMVAACYCPCVPSHIHAIVRPVAQPSSTSAAVRLPCTPLPEQLPSLLNRLFCTRLAGCKLSHACHIFFAKTAFGVGKCEITHVLCDKKPYPSGHTLYSTKPSSVCWCAAALACCVIGVSSCCDVGAL